jgi:hypothetical protein
MIIKLLTFMALFSLFNGLKFYHDLENHDEFVVQTKSPRYYYNEAELNGNCSLNGMCDG